MATLLLGPLLRFADGARATIWVEADRPCQVEVLGQRRRTFTVEGHHYALLRLDGLDPDTSTPYEVALDGRRAWPEEGSPYPPSLLPAALSARCRLVFGSCRTVLEDSGDADRVDALREFALRAARHPAADLPDTLVLLGDQVYDRQGAPATRAFMRARRDTAQPPGEEPVDFEEYTRLYQEAWGDPAVRWLLSTVPSAMIFDDHEVIDNWNTSEAWVEEIRAQPWWAGRVTGALMAYWLYQHVGNLTPDQLEDDALLAELEAGGDDQALRAHAAEWDVGTVGTPGAQWSFARDVGPVRLLMVDSRCGRVLADGRREMLDPEEWAWLAEQARSAPERLVVGSSVPLLLPRGIHHFEEWVTALAAGAWGRRVARVAERVRQDGQVNHWASFPSSFAQLTDLLGDLAAAEGAPTSVLVLSGDVHYSYVARMETGAAPVHQAVCSPLCYDLQKSIQGGFRVGMSRPGVALGRMLARLAGVPAPTRDWRLETGPWFLNVVGTVEFSDASATVRLERTTGAGEEGTRLECVAELPLGDA